MHHFSHGHPVDAIHEIYQVDEPDSRDKKADAFDPLEVPPW
jgi:hypothetical protein